MALYDEPYARKYRERDDALQQVASNQQLIDWLGRVCDRFGHPIDVLDLGCGTGRYFWGLRNVQSLVGLDASEPMLAEARHPIHADRVTATAVALVHGDLASHEFAPASFDLVYSIGVLAEHTPLDARVVANVARWTKPGGRFAFTTVHLDSASVPRTLGRSIGRLLLPLTAGQVRRRLRDRLTISGLYADESSIQDLLEPAFTIESLTRLHSEAHLHGLCVARRNAG